jgi:acyl-CoA thioesterase I
MQAVRCHSPLVWALAVLAAGFAACVAPPPPEQESRPAASAPGSEAPAPRLDEPRGTERAGSEPAAAAPATAPRVVFLGDSLTAGYGLPEQEAFPALLEAALAERGRPIQAVNAGLSGDTTAGGLRRLPWLMRQGPDLLVVALGANDGLRGQPLGAIEENLRRILQEAGEAGVPVLLLGLRLPPSHGADYARGFAEIYPRLAAELEVPLVPFLLEGVGGRPELNLPDGIHPNTAGQQVIAGALVPHLERALFGP